MLLNQAEEAGLERETLKRAAGLEKSDLRDPDARIPRSKLMALWRKICEGIDDPLFGLKVGSSYRIRDLGLVGYIMGASPTLGAALESLSRYRRIFGDEASFSIHPHGDLVDLEIDSCAELISLEHPLVIRLSALVAISREITKADIRPTAVRFPQGSPPDTEPYRLFFKCEPRFKAGVVQLTLRAADMERRVPAADTVLRRYLSDHAKGVLDSLPSPRSFSKQIWRILMIRLPNGDPGIAAVADALGLNTRTVQRRLQEEGTNYRDLRDTFRHTTARRLLANPRIPIKEIAFLLGYQDLGAFYRAFRRWENDSPRDYRRKNAAA